MIPIRFQYRDIHVDIHQRLLRQSQRAKDFLLPRWMDAKRFESRDQLVKLVSCESLHVAASWVKNWSVSAKVTGRPSK
jgi:hypothetical protein